MIDGTQRESLYECLELSFHGIKKTIESSEKIGFFWEKNSKAFVAHNASGSVVAHAGVMEIPVMVEGQNRTFAAIHAVCTHPDYRKKGFATRVLKEAVGYCSSTYENTLLFTDIPAFYVPFGFHIVREHTFVCNNSCEKNSPRELIRLKIDNPWHIDTFKRIASHRVPLSRTFSLLERGEILAFYTLAASPSCQDLYYSEKLDALIAFKIEGNRLNIFDVISTRELSLESLLRCIPSSCEEISFFFSPDSLLANVESIPYQNDPRVHGFLMAMNPSLMPQKAFMVPPYSRC